MELERLRDEELLVLARDVRAVPRCEPRPEPARACLFGARHLFPNK
jgi:hypothetical protein